MHYTLTAKNPHRQIVCYPPALQITNLAAECFHLIYESVKYFFSRNNLCIAARADFLITEANEDRHGCR